MLRRLGYACVCQSLDDSSSRGTILRNASPERLRALTSENLARLRRVLEFNVQHGVGLFRISSDVITFSLPDALRRAARTWLPDRDGLPKIHFSSPAAGQRRGGHAEYDVAAEVDAFLRLAPTDVDFDCMLEAKAKDMALFRLRAALDLAA